MTKLYHPTLPDVTVEVDDEGDMVDRHLAAGWKKTEVKAVKEARAAEGAE